MKKLIIVLAFILSAVMLIESLSVQAINTIVESHSMRSENAEPLSSSGNTFQEVNDITIEYMDSNGWHTANSSQVLDSANLSGIKFKTPGKPYYFNYRTRNLNSGWQSSVLSTNPSDYAGLTNDPITNIAVEVYENGTRIYDNYVIFYSVKIADNGYDRWLDWVSNASPEVMIEIANQFGYSSNLDINATDAGWASKGQIYGFEIHIFERIGYTPDTTGNEFQEVTNFTQKYWSSNSSSWNNLNSNVNVNYIEGVKLQTTDSTYYLEYKSREAVHGWWTPVLSTDSSEYAGYIGRSMTNLSIAVRTDSGYVYDDFVVMYRARVAGEWLEWVSNGRPAVMQKIQYEFNLPGTLDTSSTDAGWASRGNIQGLEIRIFKRIGGTGSGTSGSAMHETNDASLQYSILNSSSLKTVSNSNTPESSAVDTVKLQTTNKPYYFYYRVKSGGVWGAFVSSKDNVGVGSSNTPITNIEIRVYNSAGTRIYNDYVVMYRAYAANDNDWLNWVSNGTPAIMQALKTQYNISGTLDTSGTDAGWESHGDIIGLQIRVFETNALSTPSGTAKTIDAPYINQHLVGMPNGCESVSTVMALKYYGVDISTEYFVSHYLPTGAGPVNGVGADPELVYVGNPRNSSGWGCYQGVIDTALNKFISQYNLTSIPLSHVSLNYLCSTYIDNDVPVIIWATVGMVNDNRTSKWRTPDGTQIEYINKLHCLLLVGYDSSGYYFNDPLECKLIHYSKSYVEVAYELLESRALVITSNVPAPTPVSIDDDLTSTIDTSTEIPKKDPLPIEYEADPIDLSIGAHVIQHTLMSIYGAQTLNLNTTYRSNILTVGSLGQGWSYNYEKQLVDTGTDIYVFDSPTYYAVYTPAAGQTNTYTTSTPTKEGYSITKTATGYVVNCNYNSTEYYNTSGNLTKITAKGGLNTLITYPNASTIRITDEVSGRYLTLTKNSSGKIVSIEDNSGRTCVLGYTGDSLSSITDENGNTIYYYYYSNGQIERGKDAFGTTFFKDYYDAVGRVINQDDGIPGTPTTMISYDDTSTPNCMKVTVSDRNRKDTVYLYNSDKQLINMTDPNGTTTNYTYDSLGNLSSVKDGLENTEFYVYNANNRLTSYTDKLGRTTTYAYDSRGNLTQITYPNSSTVTNAYDSSDHLISSTDVRGVVHTYEYNNQNLLSKSSYLGRNTLYSYTNGQVTSVTDPLSRTTTSQYNSKGFLTSVIDDQNNVTQYTYDNKGNILTVTDAENNTTVKEYDANGNVTKTTDANNNSTAYTYDGNMNMTSMRLPNGAVFLYTYDNEDRVTGILYPDGTSDYTAYDDGGRVIGRTDREENVTEYEYDDANNIISITDANGGVTYKEYDENGKVTEITDQLENATQYTYDLSDNLTKVTNALGGETIYTYNAAGDLLTVTDPLNNTTTNTYDSVGNLTSVTDPRGYSTSYTYDNVGNLITVTNALNQTTTNTYNSLNQLVSTEDPGGHTTTYGYDSIGRLTSKTDARNNTVNYYYDAVGNMIKEENESGNTVFEAVYNDIGKIEEYQNSAGNITTFDYDFSGNMVEKTDALNRVCTYSYDGVGNMISSVDEAGKVSYATYDGMGNCTSTTGPNGFTTEYTYDSAGNLSAKMNVTGENDEYTYNALGLKTYIFYASLDEATISYDAAGRVTSVQDGVSNAYYTYDANGNVLTARDGVGTVTREYDALNRVTKYTDTYGKVIEYTYDSCGNLASMKYPTGDIAIYTYDANHNMTSSYISGSQYVTTYTYNLQNQITQINNPDGSTVTKTYDNAGRLTSIVDEDSSGNKIVNDSYTYDAVGKMITETSGVYGVRYEMTYDSLGRLTNRKEINVSTEQVTNEESFTYDDAGNITSDSTTSGSGNTFQYVCNNCISKVNNRRHYVNENGNTVFYDLNGTKVNVTYDARNRLKRVNGHYNEYWYDVENNRIDMFYYSTNMIYTYDTSGGRNRLAWSMDHNYAETIYAYGADGLMWSLCNGTYRVYHYDYRGSVVAVTDINGTVTDTIRYNAYGSVYARTGSTNLIFGYNGRDGVLTDPNGLLYMRARYYDPLLKRFMNCDILTGSIANPSTLNLYAYVNGDPISYVDPFGMSAERSNNNNNGLIIYTGNIGMDGDTSYGDMSKDDLKSLKWISWWDFFFHNEYSHDAEFKNLLDTLSISENFMDGVVEEMYYHFLLGKGEDYENMWLTANVENHPKTQAYMNDFMKVFTKLISENNGNIQSFADSDDFHNMLKENGVFLSKYSYGGGLLDSDTYAGLTIAIHSWTANEVRVNWYKQEGNNYSGELNFRFTDVFGLNKEDIESYGYLQGFRSWFILQHYDEYAGRYIPFTTVVNIRYQFSGTLD